MGRVVLLLAHPVLILLCAHTVLVQTQTCTRPSSSAAAPEFALHSTSSTVYVYTPPQNFVDDYPIRRNPSDILPDTATAGTLAFTATPPDTSIRTFDVGAGGILSSTVVTTEITDTGTVSSPWFLDAVPRTETTGVVVVHYIGETNQGVALFSYGIADSTVSVTNQQQIVNGQTVEQTTLTGLSGSGDLVISPDGNFVYIVPSTSETIITLKVNYNAITAVPESMSIVNIRDLDRQFGNLDTTSVAISTTTAANYTLFVATQAILMYTVDPDTGALTFIGEYTNGINTTHDTRLTTDKSADNNILYASVTDDTIHVIRLTNEASTGELWNQLTTRGSTCESCAITGISLEHDNQNIINSIATTLYATTSENCLAVFTLQSQNQATPSTLQPPDEASLSDSAGEEVRSSLQYSLLDCNVLPNFQLTAFRQSVATALNIRPQRLTLETDACGNNRVPITMISANMPSREATVLRSELQDPNSDTRNRLRAIDIDEASAGTTNTSTNTMSSTATMVPTHTTTPTSSITVVPTHTTTRTSTASSSVTTVPTHTASPSRTYVPKTSTATPTQSATQTQTAQTTTTSTPTGSTTRTTTPTKVREVTKTSTPTITVIPTHTRTPTPTPVPTIDATPPSNPPSTPRDIIPAAPTPSPVPPPQALPPTTPTPVTVIPTAPQPTPQTPVTPSTPPSTDRGLVPTTPTIPPAPPAVPAPGTNQFTTSTLVLYYNALASQFNLDAFRIAVRQLLLNTTVVSPADIVVTTLREQERPPLTAVVFNVRRLNSDAEVQAVESKLADAFQRGQVTPILNQAGMTGVEVTRFEVEVETPGVPGSPGIPGALPDNPRSNDDEDDESSVGTGVIVAIIIGAIVLCLCCILLAFVLWRWRKKDQNKETHEMYSNIIASGGNKPAYMTTEEFEWIKEQHRADNPTAISGQGGIGSIPQEGEPILAPPTTPALKPKSHQQYQNLAADGGVEELPSIIQQKIDFYEDIPDQPMLDYSQA